MQNLKSLNVSPQTQLRDVLLAAHMDGYLTPDEHAQLSAAYGSLSITTILSLLASLPTLIAAITKAIPELQKVVQQIIDLFKNFPKPNPGPNPDGGTVVPTPIT